MSNLLNGLNDAQKEAVMTTEGPLLVLAGAGSGKTKTVITRAAYIIEQGLSTPDHILVLTFTNKAAKEMLERGKSLIPGDDQPIFSTFHAWGVQFLKKYVNYSNEISDRFTIIDQSDQESIIKKISAEVAGANNDEEFLEDFDEKKFCSFLTVLQNNLVPYDGESDDKISSLLKDGSFLKEYIFYVNYIYFTYKQFLRKNNSVDFDDLINIPISILKENNSLCMKIRNSYKYIMVDEFQDTNSSQIELLKLILNKEINICVVGDDSQSIYGWRGAKIDYILNFKYKKLINLNINYRSSSSIVDAANKLLGFSNQRHKDKKDLVPFTSDKGKIHVKKFTSEQKEFEYIGYQISKIISRGGNPSDIVILYRTKIFTRSIEVELLKRRIPYKITGDMSLLDRKMLKALTDFFKFIFNRQNAYSFNNYVESLLPKGAFNKMLIESDGDIFGLIESGEYENIPRIGRSTKEKIVNILEDVNEFEDVIKETNIYDALKYFIPRSQLFKSFAEILPDDKSDKMDIKARNQHLLNIYTEIANGMETLEEFLETVSLRNENADENIDKVNLMTIHASKGLEFKNVFICAAADKILPSKRSLEGGTAKREEEMRLFYVAITRAKENLYMTFSVRYNFFQTNSDLTVSRYIKNILS